jgi:Tfp pilus assembly protein PilE
VLDVCRWLSIGFALVEGLIVRAISGLQAAIAIPNYATARCTTQRRACINNLRQIDSAKQEWALEIKGILSELAAGEAPRFRRTFGAVKI